MVLINPPVYSRADGLADFIKLHITVALGDASCIHGLVATALSQLSMLRAKSGSQTAAQEASAILDECSHHIFEGVHLLHKKFENAGEALSLASISGAAFLGLTAVSDNCSGCYRVMEQLAVMFHKLAFMVLTFLSTMQSHLGNQYQLATHRQGMVKMVELRGGIDTLPRHFANQVTRWVLSTTLVLFIWLIFDY